MRFYTSESITFESKDPLTIGLVSALLTEPKQMVDYQEMIYTRHEMRKDPQFMKDVQEIDSQMSAKLRDTLQQGRQ